MKQVEKDPISVAPHHGFITFLLERIFRALQFLPFQIFIGNRRDDFLKGAGYDGLTENEKKTNSLPRIQKVDKYILTFIILEVLFTVLTFTSFAQAPVVKWIIIPIVSLRIIDIFQISANTAVFDLVRISKKQNYVASGVRMVVNLLVNFFELILCYGIIYSYCIIYLTGAKMTSDAYYFSILTQVTLGFDSIAPVYWLKLVAVSQLIFSYFFSLVLIGKFVGLLPNINIVADDK